MEEGEIAHNHRKTPYTARGVGPWFVLRRCAASNARNAHGYRHAACSHLTTNIGIGDKLISEVEHEEMDVMRAAVVMRAATNNKKRMKEQEHTG